jgi:hypothetical protein
MALSKEERMYRVAKAILHILAMSDVSALYPTKVAQAAGVSRAWLYEMVGSTPEAYLRFTLDLLGRQLAMLDRRAEVRTEEQLWALLREGNIRLVRNIQSAPGILAVYFKWKSAPGPFGEGIREIESLYCAQMERWLMTALSFPPERARIAARRMIGLSTSLAYHWTTSAGEQSAYSESDLVDAISHLTRSLLTRMAREVPQ